MLHPLNQHTFSQPWMNNEWNQHFSDTFPLITASLSIISHLHFTFSVYPVFTSESTVPFVSLPHFLQFIIFRHQPFSISLQPRFHIKVLFSQAAIGSQSHFPFQLNVLDLWREKEPKVTVHSLDREHISQWNKVPTYRKFYFRKKKAFFVNSCQIILS